MKSQQPLILILVLRCFLGSKVEGFCATKSNNCHNVCRLSKSKLEDTTSEIGEELDVIIKGMPLTEDVMMADRPVLKNGYTMPTSRKSGGYGAFLDRKPTFFSGRKTDNGFGDDHMEDEDGYVEMATKGKRSKLGRMISKPFRVLSELTGKKKVVEPGTLILVRHGESQWNKNKTFTGWADPDLTEQGKREMEHAARLLMEDGYEIDVVFTSRLSRAIRSCWILLQEFNKVYLPVFKSWRLNERMVGYIFS